MSPVAYTIIQSIPVLRDNLKYFIETVINLLPVLLIIIKAISPGRFTVFVSDLHLYSTALVN